MQTKLIRWLCSSNADTCIEAAESFFPWKLGDFVGGDIIIAKKYEHKKIVRVSQFVRVMMTNYDFFFLSDNYD